MHRSFGSILASAGRRSAIDAAMARIARVCRTCPYHGACPGHFVGDASPQQQRLLAQSGCPVREMIDYTIERFDRTGLSEVIAARANPMRKERKVATVAL